MTDNHAASVRNAIVCLDKVTEEVDGPDAMILEDAQAILSDYEEEL